VTIKASIPDAEAHVPKQLAELRRAIRELGPSVAASLLPVVSNLETTINEKLASGYYTNTQTDAKVASPGTIAPVDVNASGSVKAGGDVTAGGQVVSQLPLKSPGSYGFQTVGPNYKVAYIDPDGRIGFSPSTRDSKKDLEVMPEAMADAFLGLTPYLGHYLADDDAVPLRPFLIAEDVAAAGFGPDVVPCDEEGNALTVNAPQLVPVLLAVARKQAAQLSDLGARLAALELPPA